MWLNKTNIQDEVLRAFVEVFVAEPGTDVKELLPEKQIAQNFLDLAGEATVSELASIKEARLAGEEGDHPAGCVFHPVDHGVAGRGSIESICHACHLHDGWR
jgi:condensin complex subunit 1